MTRRAKPPKYLYRIRYRRHGWKQSQYRTTLDPRAANRLAEKLQARGRPDLAALVEFDVERVALADVWEPVDWRESESGRRWFR